MKLNWKEIIKDGAWVVENLLLEDECQEFLDLATEAGIMSKKAAGDVRHRNSTTVAIDQHELAERVFERIKDYLPQEVVVDENCEAVGLEQNKSDLYGTWKPYGLNYRWRIVCYPGSGHFGPHRDGFRFIDENHRSLITINGYLTDRPDGFGGATRFLKDSIDVHQDEEKGIFTAKEDDILCCVDANKAGKAVVFFHDLMHDGEPLKDGSPPKWLFRTEVLYERDPTTAPQLTPEQREAKELLKKAEESEEKGNFSEAMSFYKKAYRLDSSLDCGH